MQEVHFSDHLQNGGIFPVIKVKYILWFYKLCSRTLSRPEDPLRVEELEPNIFND